MSLPSNSTLRRLELCVYDGGPDLSPDFLALGKNLGLETLRLELHGSMEESLCTAIADGLGMNETLDNLEITECPSNENSAMWSRALSFLRTNRALKALKITVEDDATEMNQSSVTQSMMQSCVSALCVDIAAMLEENASLETISIESLHIIETKEYVELVTAFQHNRALTL